jgi:methionyl-tRNA formyltransferase
VAALQIIFMGTAELSCASLEMLVREFSVAAVVTQPDRPKGRELKLKPPPVKVLAQKLNLPVMQPTKARDDNFIARLRELKPDLIVVAAYGQILPQAILDLPPHGCVNVHASLLPKYRGAAPIQWAIANGDSETGVTIMKIEASLDSGPILSQRRTPILPTDDSQILLDRLARLGAGLLAVTIPGYVAGTIQPRPQPAEGVVYAAKIRKEDGKIDWHWPAQKIFNRLRAFTPWPGAFTFLPDVVGRASSRAEAGVDTPERLAGTLAPPKPLLKIWKAEVAENSGRAGEVLSADKSGIVVGCGEDALRILELQREGGKRLTAEQFLAGHPLKPGERW